MEPLIRDITDTARWVAIFRADESDRPDAVFHDPFARRLAGERGKQIADAIEFSRQNSWSFVSRTYLFDEFISQALNDGADMIINIAAGLDARPYRMKIPSKTKWIEVDFPAMIEYKAGILKNEKPNCELERIALDLSNEVARRNLFRIINTQCKKALVVSEGLIGYLPRENAGTLAADLSNCPHFHSWVMDIMSPGLLKMAQKEMGSFLKAANAPLVFAPEDGEGFFLEYGWKPVDSRSLLKSAAKINRLSDEMLTYAAYPEPEGPKGEMPWSGVCLFENARALSH